MIFCLVELESIPVPSRKATAVRDFVTACVDALAAARTSQEKRSFTFVNGKLLNTFNNALGVEREGSPFLFYRFRAFLQSPLHSGGQS